MLSAISAHGYSTPTPIQVGAIPPYLQVTTPGRRPNGHGQDGGISCCPCCNCSMPPLAAAHAHSCSLRTRELAAQILESIRVYGANKKLRSRVIFGGVGERPQIDGLRIGCDILVATPGRLLDLANRGLANLPTSAPGNDEADRCSTMGFIHDIRRSSAAACQAPEPDVPATYTARHRALAARIREPGEGRSHAAEQHGRPCRPARVSREQGRQAAPPRAPLKNGANGRAAGSRPSFFTRTKHGANRLADQLSRAGIRSAAIHGNKSQAARTRALADFKAAVDGARRDRGRIARARHPRTAAGRQLRHAHVPADYVHRIGPHRAGRQRTGMPCARVVGRSSLLGTSRGRCGSVPFFSDARIRAHRAGAPPGSVSPGCARAARDSRPRRFQRRRFG